MVIPISTLVLGTPELKHMTGSETSPNGQDLRQPISPQAQESYEANRPFLQDDTLGDELRGHETAWDVPTNMIRADEAVMVPGNTLGRRTFELMVKDAQKIRGDQPYTDGSRTCAKSGVQVVVREDPDLTQGPRNTEYPIAGLDVDGGRTTLKEIVGTRRLGDGTLVVQLMSASHTRVNFPVEASERYRVAEKQVEIRQQTRGKAVTLDGARDFIERGSLETKYLQEGIFSEGEQLRAKQVLQAAENGSLVTRFTERGQLPSRKALNYEYIIESRRPDSEAQVTQASVGDIREKYFKTDRALRAFLNNGVVVSEDSDLLS